MALTGENKTKKVDGKEVPSFIAEFTNGTLEQLDELASFLKKKGIDIPNDETEKRTSVIKMGISWIETLREESNTAE